MVQPHHTIGLKDVLMVVLNFDREVNIVPGL
jgi:hypothetical protein